MQLTRRQDWPEQLAAQVAAAQRQPYVIGVHDCLRFTCQCIAAMTGVDFWSQFSGYTTLREAQEKIISVAPTLQEAVCKVLGQAAAPVAMARRGDVVLFNDTFGEHLGVCTGGHVAVLQRHGLLLLPISHSGMVCSVRVA
jgi:cell wall-associated NlpC family hydrolase